MKNIKLVSIRGNYCNNFPLNNIHVLLIIIVRFFSVFGEGGGGALKIYKESFFHAAHQKLPL